MTLTDILAWSLALVLTLSSIAKVTRRRVFEDSLIVFGITHARSRRTLSLAVPTLELALGLAVAFRWFPQAPYAVAALFVAFDALLISARLLAVPGQEPSCCCTGRLRPIRWTSIAFNGACALIALWVAQTS